MDITPAQKLAALYNNACQVGRGVLRERGRDQMTVEQAQELLDQRQGITYFDYCHGREMKVDVDDLNEDGRLYDRAYGEGAYALVMMNLETGGSEQDKLIDGNVHDK
ncbi:hypothetical protein GCM10010423_64870 [Streptomyces levis]|uniref:Uncharacterized protein n=1 Tax=Streptomyces levis TaxID=285566 RepID=A0ABN3P2H0_9ACTN